MREMTIEVRIDGMLVLWDKDTVTSDPQHMIRHARMQMGRLTNRMASVAEANRRFFRGVDPSPDDTAPWSLIKAACGNDEGLKRVLRGTPEQVVAHFTAVSEPCPVCGATTVACPSGTVCPNGHGF